MSPMDQSDDDDEEGDDVVPETMEPPKSNSS